MDVYSLGRYHQPSEGKSIPIKGEAQNLDPFSVDRQDSLMLCQQLQEKDGVDFMDQNMDLTPYLNDLQDIDGDVGEELIDKQRLIESDIFAQQYGYPPHYTDLGAYEPKDDDIIGTAPATPSQLPGRNVIVKMETPWEDEPTTAEQSSQPTTSSRTSKEQIEITYTPTIKPRKYSLKPETPWEDEPTTAEQSSQPTTSSRTSKEQIEITYTPTIKPRKYSLKPEAEKKNPLYRLKREKNNDAVRKSRSKAKEQQRMKDNQIKELQEKVGVMNQLLERIKLLESALREEQVQKAEVLAENKRLKSELGLKKSARQRNIRHGRIYHQ
ncbi:hypothetical protein Tcan_08576 [Toxocara canis]|uniref:BZIP domain-containing protein n=1 Tax=Toxocara canis TaxID=6265 RepID=A0A0B2V0T0_TOXCA|nr:hypothetical protein Tcan_08576 [Toxocara canis]